MREFESAGALRCSFCERSQADVRKLVAGPNGVAICDECLDVCNDIVADAIADSSTFGETVTYLKTGGLLTCPKCQKPTGVSVEAESTSDRLELSCRACGHRWPARAPGTRNRDRE